MFTAILNEAYRLEVGPYDFMDLMRDAGMIPSIAPNAKPALTMERAVSDMKRAYRDWTYDFFDLMDDAKAAVPSTPAEPIRLPLRTTQPVAAAKGFAQAA